MKRLGLMGGTFDPIHYGHLRLAEEAREQYSLDRVVFIPNRTPVHRTHAAAPPEDRLAMALLATAGHPDFEVSRLEIDRDAPSYSVDTAAAFRAQFPDAGLYFITGADELLDLARWYRAEELLAICEFLGAPRPGHELDGLEERIPARLRHRIHLVHMRALEISATDIRERAAAGRSLRYLTPDAVGAFIRKRELYRLQGCPAVAAEAALSIH